MDAMHKGCPGIGRCVLGFIWCDCVDGRPIYDLVIFLVFSSWCNLFTKFFTVPVLHTISLWPSSFSSFCLLGSRTKLVSPLLASQE